MSEPIPVFRRAWKDPGDPTFNPNRKRDQMMPEEHDAYRARVLARRRARRLYRAERLAAAARKYQQLGGLHSGGTS